MMGTVGSILLIIVLLAIMVAAICGIAFLGGFLLITKDTSIVLEEERPRDDAEDPERVNQETNQEEKS